MTTPTPKDEKAGDGATESPKEPTRDDVVVTTTDDADDLAEFADRGELESGSYVSTSDAVTEPDSEAPGKEDASGSEGDDDSSDGATGKASPGAATETTTGKKDAGADGKAAGEGPGTGEGDAEGEEPGQKPGRRARKLRRLQAENEELRRRTAELEAKARQTDGAPAAKPTPDDYDDWEKYAEALADWKVAEKEREAGSSADQEATGKQPIPESWGEVMDEHDDYEAVAFNETLIVSDAMANQLIGMGAEGAELLYQLGKHPEEAKRIARVSGDAAVARELGRFEASLDAPEPPDKGKGNGQGKTRTNGSGSTEAGKAADAPRVSSAPEPTPASEGGGAGQGGKSKYDAASPSEYRALREAEMKARGEL